MAELSTSEYLSEIGVPTPTARTCPFDPGYDLYTLKGHLEQSGHLMAALKLSMACWMLADERVSREKVAAAHAHGVPTTTGGGPFEVAVAQRRLPHYLDLCADMGFVRIECGQGFTDSELDVELVVKMAKERDLDVQFELGSKHGGAFTRTVVQGLLDTGHRWLDAGAVELVIEARESAQGVGLFDDAGQFDPRLADLFAEELGLDSVLFEAPTKSSQFALLDHFGREVRLCNVRLEEILRVEIYRHGLHSDSFGKARLRPPFPADTGLGIVAP